MSFALEDAGYWNSPEQCDATNEIVTLRKQVEQLTKERDDSISDVDTIAQHNIELQQQLAALSEQVEKMTKERDEWRNDIQRRDDYIAEQDHDYNKKTNRLIERHAEQLAALAEQNEKIREALVQQNFWADAALRCPAWDWDGDQREAAEGCLAFAKESLSLPDLASPVLNRIRAEALNKAAKWFNDNVDNRTDTWQAQELRRMAAELEKTNG